MDQNCPPRVAVEGCGTIARPAAFGARAGTFIGFLARVTIGLNAALLFLLQPMIAKAVLPTFGGAPTVWIAAMLFFQLVLVAAYFCAHVMASLPLRGQWVAYFGIFGAALWALPIALPAMQPGQVAQHPVQSLVWILTSTVGLPLLATSLSGPVIQRWFSCSRHTRARDPYFLFAFSNLGSFVGLLAYPLCLQPLMGLSWQFRTWTLAFLVLLVGMAMLAAAVGTGAVDAEPRDEVQLPPTAVSWRTVVLWLALSFVPSSLMLGVTTYLSSDIAAVPLLWVIPLAVYLLSFVVAFNPPGRIVTAATRLLPLLVLTAVVMYGAGVRKPLSLVMIVPLLALFAAAIVCHRKLRDLRPHSRDLTGFYVWVAIGGALGGIFNVIAAPLLFVSPIEYPVALVLSCLALPSTVARRWARWFELEVAIGAAAVTVLATVILRQASAREAAAVVAAVAGPSCVYLAFRKRPVVFAASAVLLLAAITLAFPPLFDRTLYAHRDFFGIVRVAEDVRQKRHVLFHGTIIHGVQDTLAPTRSLSYYHPQSPVADLFRVLRGRSTPVEAAVIGLGTGALAIYAEPGERWWFYELNPTIVSIATTPALFSYVRQSHGTVRIVMGDARLSLESAPDGKFSLLVLDAFSSDAIPVHLLTREALRLYRTKMAPDGVLLYHISNRYLDLEPVVSALAADARLGALGRNERTVSPLQARLGYLGSHWIVLTNNGDVLNGLRGLKGWTPLSQAVPRVWTDDYSHLLPILRWR